MDDKTISHISVEQDNPTGIASRVHGANIDAVAFNITLIASKNPTLAVKLMELYQEAYTISPSDPPHPEEDFTAALDNLPNPFKA